MEFPEMGVLPQVLLIRAVVNSGSIPIDGNPHIATMLVENLMGLQAVRRCLNFPLVAASAMKCCASGGNSVPIKISSSSTTLHNGTLTLWQLSALRKTGCLKGSTLWFKNCKDKHGIFNYGSGGALHFFIAIFAALLQVTPGCNSAWGA